MQKFLKKGYNQCVAISLQAEKFNRFQANVLGPRDSFTFEKLVINDTLKKQLLILL